VGEHEVPGRGADVEFDDVDPDLQSGVKRLERVGRRQGAGSSVADALTRLHWHRSA
jgi:hypothetical protein